MYGSTAWNFIKGMAGNNYLLYRKVALSTTLASPSGLRQRLVVMDRLLPLVNQRHDEVAKRITDVSRDLRGIISSTHNARSYSMVFDCLYPKYFPLFVDASRTWADTPDVLNPLLKMFAELVWNRSQRIVFDNSSPNGILLFRETSKAIVNAGSALLQVNPGDELYKKKLKPIFICYQLLARSLDGGYVNFGVFRLYNDSCKSLFIVW
jgi:exportin-7